MFDHCSKEAQINVLYLLQGQAVLWFEKLLDLIIAITGLNPLTLNVKYHILSRIYVMEYLCLQFKLLLFSVVCYEKR